MTQTTRMNWEQLMSNTRFLRREDGAIEPVAPKDDTQNWFRSGFHVDYDRLVFSNAFRRLGRKTQVHPLAKNDHTHNRLTHSVEVGSVGRSLGNKVAGMLHMAKKLPQALDVNDFGLAVQVACLAHDLGNPPFGHTGEDALREWFRQPENAVFLQGLSIEEKNDVATYEGNAHSLRQVASLEMYHNRGGMRLSAASVGALLKYPWTSSSSLGRKKFSIYQTELPFIRCVAEELGLPEIENDTWARHPLSYLMEAADDICYALMDLEDAMDLELLDVAEVESVMNGLVDTELTWRAHNERERIAMMRGLSIGSAIDEVALTFVRHQNDLLNGEFQGKDLLSVCNENVRDTLNHAKKLAQERIYHHRSKLIHELAAFPCLSSILDLLVPSVFRQCRQETLTTQQRLALNLLHEDPVCPGDNLYLSYMKILDFVGAMTDNYAAKMARELSGMNMI